MLRELCRTRREVSEVEGVNFYEQCMGGRTKSYDVEVSAFFYDKYQCAHKQAREKPDFLTELLAASLKMCNKD